MCAGGGASVDACGCLAFVRPSQLVVYGGTSVVNGQLHFPKDVYSFDLGGWRQRAVALVAALGPLRTCCWCSAV